MSLVIEDYIVILAAVVYMGMLLFLVWSTLRR